MEVKQENKSLYHIQNMTIGTDGYPIDFFVWCKHFPTGKDLKKIAQKEFDRCDDIEAVVDEFVCNSEIYKVYADEI